MLKNYQFLSDFNHQLFILPSVIFQAFSITSKQPLVIMAVCETTETLRFHAPTLLQLSVFVRMFYVVITRSCSPFQTDLYIPFLRMNGEKALQKINALKIFGYSYAGWIQVPVIKYPEPQFHSFPKEIISTTL